jgi:hypothetical protein
MRRPLFLLFAILCAEICSGAVPVCKYFVAAAQEVPGASGHVVNAVTGQPIQGLHVTLMMSTFEGWSVKDQPQKSAVSDASGAFSLPGFTHPMRNILDGYRSYWIIVSEDGGGGSEVSPSNFILYGQGRRSALDGHRVERDYFDRQYFPLTVSIVPKGCDRIWPAACMSFKSWGHVEIPIVPVVQDVGDCQRIADESLKENCRELNTYRAAFTHIGTNSYEEVQKAKAMCAEVDHGVISGACLSQLPLYQGGLASQHKLPPQREQPVPAGVFPVVVAALPVRNRQCGLMNLFDGGFWCTGNYGGRRIGVGAAAFVTIERWPTGTKSFTNFEQLEHGDGESVEVREGGAVLRREMITRSGELDANGQPYTVEHKGTMYSWPSGDARIKVGFYDPIPQAEKFLDFYLQKYPSTAK